MIGWWLRHKEDEMESIHVPFREQHDQGKSSVGSALITADAVQVITPEQMQKHASVTLRDPATR